MRAEQPPTSYLDAAQAISDASYVAYRKLVYETPGFTDYFFNGTPIREITELNSAHGPRRARPRARSRTCARSVGLQLGPVPRVAAWLVRLRAGDRRLSAEDVTLKEKRVALLRQMYARWPFFRTLLLNLDMVLAKCDLAIAERYMELVDDRKLARRIFAVIRNEWVQTCDAVTLITGHADRLHTNPALARSIAHRFPYLDPLNHLQVELMRRSRRQRDGGIPDNERVRNGILISINGLAAGLRNTG